MLEKNSLLLRRSEFQDLFREYQYERGRKESSGETSKGGSTASSKCSSKVYVREQF